jgi:hypothetical protein
VGANGLDALGLIAQLLSNKVAGLFPAAAAARAA